MARTFRSLLGGCLAGVAGLALAGCGARSILETKSYQDNTFDDDAGSDASTDGPITDGPIYDQLADVQGCNPSNCDGCCSEELGKCVPGLAPDACGIGGYACVDCTAFNASCNAGTHKCGSSEKCSPATCPNGCCTDDGDCVSGSDSWACGSGGSTCSDCSAYGMSCDPYAKYCTTQQDCGPYNCAGCCTSWGTCEWGGDTFACGAGGQQCQDCSWTGSECDPDLYQCTSIEQCGPATCSYGCCDQYSGQCLGGFDPWACGSGGSVCQTCTSDNEKCLPSAVGGGICQLVTTNCGPSTCAGCCDQSSGKCMDGLDPYACGYGGAVCQYCADPNLVCEATWNGGGQCIYQTQYCDPSNCGGCCDYTIWPPQCVWGGDPWACGFGGNACSSCDQGQQCELTPMGGGQCTGASDCGSWNCNGCCDYSTWPPQCLWGGDSWACGSYGDACYPCGAGATCQYTGYGGYCAGYQDAGVDCGPWNCAGCCNYNTYPPACETGTYTWSCGAKGEQCMSCPVGSQCASDPWGGGTCSTPPPPPIDGGVDCGPWNCPGCCMNGACYPGIDHDMCGSNGSMCVSCSPSQPCVQTSSGGGVCWSGADAGVPDAQPVDVGSCGPWNCNGCCTPNGNCVPGKSNLRCGTGGEQCVNCTLNNGTCSAGDCVYPNTCPAPYGGCPSYQAVTAPYTKPYACSAGTLDKILALCAGPTPPPDCNQALISIQQSDPGCGDCIWQFVGPNAAAICVAPYLSDTCNHAVACTFDCLNVACSQCPDADEQQCRDSALWNSGTCSGYTQGAFCYQSALQGQGSFCTWNGDFGKWIYTVGNHYCGTGSP